MITKAQADQLKYLIEVRDQAIGLSTRFEAGTTNYTQEHCMHQVRTASKNLSNYINLLTDQKITSNIADLNAKIHGKR